MHNLWAIEQVLDFVVSFSPIVILSFPSGSICFFQSVLLLIWWPSCRRIRSCILRLSLWKSISSRISCSLRLVNQALVLLCELMPLLPAYHKHNLCLLISLDWLIIYSFSSPQSCNLFYAVLLLFLIFYQTECLYLPTDVSFFLQCSMLVT